MYTFMFACVYVYIYVLIILNLGGNTPKQIEILELQEITKDHEHNKADKTFVIEKLAEVSASIHKCL